MGGQGPARGGGGHRFEPCFYPESYSTLSMAGSDYVRNAGPRPIVIIDEAGQAVEPVRRRPRARRDARAISHTIAGVTRGLCASFSANQSTLIPLRKAVRMLVLVGDPRQLPATVRAQYVNRRGSSQEVRA